MIVYWVWTVFIADFLDLLTIVIDELMLGKPVSFEPYAAADLREGLFVIDGDDTVDV